MQAVILAGGKSTRTYPLTLTKPKPLLTVANKTILEHNLEALNAVDEIIMVVGYKRDMIKDFVKKKYPKLKIKYVHQKDQLGTGHAVSILEKQIKNRFILMLGDNIYSKHDVKTISKHPYSILVKKSKNWQDYGVIKQKNNILTDIVEKPKKFISDLINCGLLAFDKKIFQLLKKTKKSKRDEYELTDAIKVLAKQNKVYCVRSSACYQITYPWNLLAADNAIRGNKNLIGRNSKIKYTFSPMMESETVEFLSIIVSFIIMEFFTFPLIMQLFPIEEFVTIPFILEFLPIKFLFPLMALSAANRFHGYVI